MYTLKYHGQNSTTIALHDSNPIPPRILQSSLHNPGCPNITLSFPRAETMPRAVTHPQH